MTLYVLGCLAFGAWAAAVAVCDVRSRRVPNALVLAGFVAALAAACARAGPLHIDLGAALVAAALGFVALLPFYLLRVMGAADVKVFAVLGAWCGKEALIALWLVASVAALVHVLALLIATRARRAHTSSDGRRARVIAVGARRGTPFATCLTAPALAWLVLQLVAGGVR
ncbi:A24 family peptidase [Paraburkholderia acidisoli]|uniref:Prepilin peptidase n=1 Tax=Paraburkholderia acidisoli TaxID=2571748 RepID=A0A7Z2GHU7_9BURK|nr:prepilin peptidase [Paraburkholderia acidisoli]QGZ61699.1 prepilin peptidase [Paraburkholderia acidisoli]